MYDILIVGAGITAAALAASLKHKYKICIIDVRKHIGGNCYDYKANGAYIHQYGPHFFHTDNKEVIEFVSKYTQWTPYQHSVCAEIKLNGEYKTVPFPYSKQTSSIIGNLTEEQIIDTFFKGYSKKMWGVDWDQLPNTIKGRVPKDTKDTSVYFPGQFSAIPTHGYSNMIENMIDGCDLILGASEDEWQAIPATHIVYCGRIDRIKLNNGLRIGSITGKWLDFRDLEIKIEVEKWKTPASVLNYCHNDIKCTRKTSYGHIYGSNCEIITKETPIDGPPCSITPFYPVPTSENYEKHKILKDIVIHNFPNIILAGRIATHKYMDMDQCFGQALSISKNFI